MNNKIKVLLLGIAFAVTGYANDNCAKSRITGEKCEDLQVEFDLSQCDEGKGFTKAKITCDKAGATASLSTPKANYSQSFKADSQWETVNWVASSHITRRPVVAKASKKASAKSDKSPDGNLGAHVSDESHERELAAQTANAGIVFSGYFDAYYAYHFGKPGTTAAPTAPATLRQISP